MAHLYFRWFFIAHPICKHLNLFATTIPFCPGSIPAAGHISVCNQPPRSTHPGHPFVDRHNEYQPKGGDALGMVCVWVAGKTVQCPVISEHFEVVHHDKVLYKFLFTLLYFTLWTWCVFQAVVTRGGRFLEAPVIGSKQLAKDGQLVVIAAGDRTLYDDCQSCLQAMARHMFYIG